MSATRTERRADRKRTLSPLRRALRKAYRDGNAAEYQRIHNEIKGATARLNAQDAEARMKARKGA